MLWGIQLSTTVGFPWKTGCQTESQKEPWDMIVGSNRHAQLRWILLDNGGGSQRNQGVAQGHAQLYPNRIISKLLLPIRFFLFYSTFDR
eukprot:scaffold1170_cov174-Amphora_coffeaeformis.AAC.22